MTYEEFKARTDTIFRRSPLVPAVLELVGGQRLTVDMPEQAEIRPDTVVIRRKTEPTAYRIGYEEIDRVTPLDELPAETGGLSYAEFYATVRPLLWRGPYQPFVIELRDGSRLLIDKPGRLSLAGRFGVFLPPGPVPLVRFTYDQVVRVSLADLAKAG